MPAYVPAYGTEDNWLHRACVGMMDLLRSEAFAWFLETGNVRESTPGSKRAEEALWHGEDPCGRAGSVYLAVV